MEGWSTKNSVPPSRWTQGNSIQFPETKMNSVTSVWVQLLGLDTDSSSFPRATGKQGSENSRGERGGGCLAPGKWLQKAKLRAGRGMHKPLCQAQCQVQAQPLPPASPYFFEDFAPCLPKALCQEGPPSACTVVYLLKTRCPPKTFAALRQPLGAFS
jgi:hypothetical protein